ncbi:MAG: reverse transcriptase/maturase family protein, partial [Pirellulaceae bacterium]
DRVVHHALVNVLEPLFERRFIYDSYACRRGKGTHRAIRRAEVYLRRYPFYLKTDIVKFFPNVDHEMLLSTVERTIADERVMALIRTIVASGDGILADEATPRYFPGDDLFAILRPRGIPIGNLTSQFFANVLLDPVDHFVKEQLRVPGYIRYADDLLLFGASKAFLWDSHAALSGQLARLRLWLHPRKTQLRPSDQRLSFLGFVISRSGRRLTQDCVRRFNRRIRRQRWLLTHGKIDQRRISASVRAWLAHASHANSRGIRKELWKRLRF